MFEAIGLWLIGCSVAGLGIYWRYFLKAVLAQKQANRRQVICSCGYSHNYKVDPGQPVVCLKCASVLFKPGEIEHYNDYDI